MSTLKYCDAHFDWIEDNLYVYSTSADMAKAFEEKFNITMTDTRMRSLWKRLGLRKGTQHRYTQDEDLWLAEYANTVPYSKLSELFNNEFDTNVTTSALQQHCNIHLGIYSDNPNEFNNCVAWNKLPIGSETLDKRFGTMLIKTENGWVNKARYVYEKVYGEIPKNHQVIFLDSNRQNFDIDNLYCIPIKHMILMNRNNWCTENRDVTLAAIEYCKLYYGLQEVKYD